MGPLNVRSRAAQEVGPADFLRSGGGSATVAGGRMAVPTIRESSALMGGMFGTFAGGVQEWYHFDRSIPPAPFSFLPVRASVRHRDPRFLKDTPNLAAALAAAEDDGRDVFEHIPCDWKAVRAWASSLPVPRKP